MKAKFVYESIGFERGREPKEAMGLGKLKDSRIDEIRRN